MDYKEKLKYWRQTLYEKALFFGSIIVLFAVLLSAQAEGVTTYVQDDFNRADGNLGTATNGKIWYTISGTTIPFINGNRGVWVDNGANPSAYLNFTNTTGNGREFCYDLLQVQNTLNNINMIMYNQTTQISRIEFISSKSVRLFQSPTSLINLSYYASATKYTVCVNQTNTSWVRISINNVTKGNFRTYNNNTGFIGRIWIESSANTNNYVDNLTIRAPSVPCVSNITETLVSNVTWRECAYYPANPPSLRWLVLVNETYEYVDEEGCNVSYPYNETASIYYFCDACVLDWQNTTSAWVNLSSCYSNDTAYQSRYVYEYDAAECKVYNASNPPLYVSLRNASVNTTYYRWGSCTYSCNESIVNVTSPWVNSTPCLYNGSQLQERWLYAYDENLCGYTNATNTTQNRYTACEYSALSCTVTVNLEGSLISDDVFLLILGFLNVWMACAFWYTRKNLAPVAPDFVIAGLSVGALAVLAVVDAGGSASMIYLVCCIAAGVMHGVRIVTAATGGSR